MARIARIKRRWGLRLSMIALAFACVAQVFATPALAQPAIPDPTDLFYVNDFAGALRQDTIDEIVAQNDKLYAKTGAQIVVTTVDFLGGWSIGDYTYQMFQQWGIGSSDKNNGVLLVLAIGDQDYRILQGSGLEKSLSAGTLDDILWNNLEEDFAAGNYDAGVQKVFAALMKRMDAIYGLSNSAPSGTEQPDKAYPPSDSRRRAPSLFSMGLGLLFLVIFLTSLGGSMRRRGVRTYYPPPPMWGFRYPPPPLWGNRRRPPPPPPGGFGGFGGGSSRSGGGGASRGGGAGRRR